MDNELLYLDNEVLLKYFQNADEINKIEDTLKYVNFLYSNDILIITPDESNFNKEIELIDGYEEYTNSDKRCEINCLVVEESVELLNIMGIKTDTVVNVNLTDVYNIYHKLYNKIVDETIKEITTDDVDELIEDLFTPEDSDGTDYRSIIMDITDYFINNFNKYKKAIVTEEIDLTIDNKVSKLINIDPSYCTAKPIIDWFSKERLESNKELYLSEIVKDNDNVDTLKIVLTSFVYLYYTLEEYNRSKDNIKRLLALCDVETLEIEDIVNYIDNTLKDLNNG